MFIVFMSIFSVLALFGIYSLINGFFDSKTPITIIYTEQSENDTEYDIRAILSRFSSCDFEIIINGHSEVAYILAKDFPNIKISKTNSVLEI